MGARSVCVCLILVGLAGGTLSYVRHDSSIVTRDGRRVIAADFHVHGAGADGVLSPFGLVILARHRGLGAFAVTNHNQIMLARVTRSIARRLGGPTVLVGEEITGKGFHLIGVGLTKRVDWNQSPVGAIRAIHAQNGVAIAAHPVARYWPSFDASALALLDGTEVLHPIAIDSPTHRSELRSFYERAKADGHRVSAVGSSDYHWRSAPNVCRTFVFVRDESAAAILDALREARTVVYDDLGEPLGDPQLAAELAQVPLPTTPDDSFAAASLADRITRLCALLGIAGLIALRRVRSS
jgi:hypothetical protein